MNFLQSWCVPLVAWFAALAASSEPLRVCCTVPSIGSIAQEVGGDRIALTVFAKGGENPHFLDARPSHVKALAAADLFVQQGMELEIGWAPVLLQQCRNAKVQPGQLGFLDASVVVTPLEVPTAPVDRSHGDVHPGGNPHYMTDPVNGLKVARLLRERFTQLLPEAADGFAQRCARFEQRLCRALVGDALADAFPADTVIKLAELQADGRLAAFLQQQGRSEKLAGWLGVLAPYAGTAVIADHNQWIYFGRRFGLLFAGYLEPKPGVAPSTRHLGELIGAAPAANVKLVFTAPGFDPKSARFVAEKLGLPLLSLAHEVGATATATDYVAMVQFDVEQIGAALARARGGGA
ncbi:MAG: zinc ABC transporter substrate-binding protein [Planctomycetes bacterium]|nr:zinc ABC transporter substrate-binding protein [Planctomycetota bacterium]